MISVQTFTFNPFQENTYLLFGDSGSCLIIDPGCSTIEETNTLDRFIADKGLAPIGVVNTHCHIDHVLGNRFVTSKYSVELSIPEGEEPILELASQFAAIYQIPYEPSPEPAKILRAGDHVNIDDCHLVLRWVPGHSPGHLALVNHDQRFVIGGDVLFRGGIGRTDLPGGDYDTLINSIRTELLTLDDACDVYPGHGPATTIGYEKANNPFLR